MKFTPYLALLAMTNLLVFSSVAICDTAQRQRVEPEVDPNVALLIVTPSGERGDAYSRELAIELALILDGFQIQRGDTHSPQGGAERVKDLWQAGIQNRAGFVIYVNTDAQYVRRLAMVALYGNRALAKNMPLQYPKAEPEALTLLVRQLTDEILVFLGNIDKKKSRHRPPEGWVELVEETPPPKRRTQFEFSAMGSLDVALIDKKGHWGWAGGNLEFGLLFPIPWHLALELGVDTALLSGEAANQLTGVRLNGNLYFGKHWSPGRFRVILDVGVGGAHTWFNTEPASGSTSKPRWFDFKVKLRTGIYYHIGNSVRVFLNVAPALAVDRDQITIPSDSGEDVLYQAPRLELGTQLGLSVVF